MSAVQPAQVVRSGRPRPLGAHWDGEGTNFAVASLDATAVEVCLYGENDAEPEAVIALPSFTDGTWFGYVEGIGPGQKYGLRVHGPYDAEQGLRFNPAKLLIDPYTRALVGDVVWGPDVFAYDQADPENERAIDDTPNDASIPKSVVIDPAFDWEGVERPRIPWTETVFYEVHVKGATKLHPDVPEHLRGTYAGLAHPSVIEHFKEIGVTSIELLPVHASIDESFLSSKGLTNYWGYSTVGFFAPEGDYAASTASGDHVREFKEMVKAFHAAGLEVILDVVYNHACEGNHLGPTLAFKGIDNRQYYRLFPDKPEYYLDFTGTGNSLDITQQTVLDLVMDSLRYWVTEMQVDGFRFDLVVTLGRETYAFDPESAFFKVMRQDPVLADVKLVAEPWDIGEGGYQVGNFPAPWSEWNDKFRDCVRAFWNHDSRDLGQLGYRLTGSSDIYRNTQRTSNASVNLVTTHDGFTLADLVRYNGKHNEANLEDNRDGSNNNVSFNYGVEGETDDPGVTALRYRQQRNMLATLLLSRGVPLLLGGDEFSRTQNGNNNAYCQDNEISWFNWDLNANQRRLKEFVANTLRLRKSHPVLRQFHESVHQTRDEPTTAMGWWRFDGQGMTTDDWNAGGQSLAMRLELIDDEGQPIVGSDDGPVLVVIHSGAEPTTLATPAQDAAKTDWVWDVLLDSGSDDGLSSQRFQVGASIGVAARSVMVLQLSKP